MLKWSSILKHSKYYVSLSHVCDAPEVYCCCKRFQFCDGKYTEEALATAKIVIPNGCIVLLSSCVKDVNLDLLTIQHHFLSVAVSFSWLVVFNKLWGWKEIHYNNAKAFSNLEMLRFKSTAGIKVAHLIIHKLEGEGGFPHSSTAHHNHFVKG